MDVQREIVAFAQQEGMFGRGDRVVVGVSGGPDSLCLLHVLWSGREQLGIDVCAAHLNHLIRGDEADADAQFVTDLAASWGIPCTMEARDVPALAREHKMAIEEAARRARYAFLADVAQRVGATRIAVGHNADDQSETVLMHWLRGAGLAGLRGMLPVTRLADLRLIVRPEPASDVWLVRPLLQIPRPEIERYCAQHGLNPRFDRSNLDTTLHRNRLRHKLLPYLEREFRPRFAESLRRSARVMAGDYDLLCTVSDQAWRQVVLSESQQAVTLDLAMWRKLHIALQRALVRRAVQRLRWDLRDVNAQHVEAAVEVALRGATGAQATLPRGVMLIVGYTTLIVADQAYVPPPDFPALSDGSSGDSGLLPLAIPGDTALPGNAQAEVRILARSDLPDGWQGNADPWRAFLDARVMGDEAYLRTRRAGDRFCPLGLAGQHKLVGDLLVNAKVPGWWRDYVPLLVRADGVILWVCGWRLDERARVRDDTWQVAMVRLYRVG